MNTSNNINEQSDESTTGRLDEHELQPQQPVVAELNEQDDQLPEDKKFELDESEPELSAADTGLNEQELAQQSEEQILLEMQSQQITGLQHDIAREIKFIEQIYSKVASKEIASKRTKILDEINIKQQALVKAEQEQDSIMVGLLVQQIDELKEDYKNLDNQDECRIHIGTGGAKNPAYVRQVRLVGDEDAIDPRDEVTGEGNEFTFASEQNGDVVFELQDKSAEDVVKIKVSGDELQSIENVTGINYTDNTEENRRAIIKLTQIRDRVSQAKEIVKNLEPEVDNEALGLFGYSRKPQTTSFYGAGQTDLFRQQVNIDSVDNRLYQISLNPAYAAKKSAIAYRSEIDDGIELFLSAPNNLLKISKSIEGGNDRCIISLDTSLINESEFPLLWHMVKLAQELGIWQDNKVLIQYEKDGSVEFLSLPGEFIGRAQKAIQGVSVLFDELTRIFSKSIKALAIRFDQLQDDEFCAAARLFGIYHARDYHGLSGLDLVTIYFNMLKHGVVNENLCLRISQSAVDVITFIKFSRDRSLEYLEQLKASGAFDQNFISRIEEAVNFMNQLDHMPADGVLVLVQQRLASDPKFFPEIITTSGEILKLCLGVIKASTTEAGINFIYEVITKAITAGVRISIDHFVSLLNAIPTANRASFLHDFIKSGLLQQVVFNMAGIEQVVSVVQPDERFALVSFIMTNLGEFYMHTAINAFVYQDKLDDSLVGLLRSLPTAQERWNVMSQIKINHPGALRFYAQAIQTVLPEQYLNDFMDQLAINNFAWLDRASFMWVLQEVVSPEKRLDFILQVMNKQPALFATIVNETDIFIHREPRYQFDEIFKLLASESQRAELAQQIIQKNFNDSGSMINSFGVLVLLCSFLVDNNERMSCLHKMIHEYPAIFKGNDDLNACLLLLDNIPTIQEKLALMQEILAVNPDFLAQVFDDNFGRESSDYVDGNRQSIRITIISKYPFICELLDQATWVNFIKLVVNDAHRSQQLARAMAENYCFKQVFDYLPIAERDNFAKFMLCDNFIDSTFRIANNDYLMGLRQYLAVADSIAFVQRMMPRIISDLSLAAQMEPQGLLVAPMLFFDALKALPAEARMDFMRQFMVCVHAAKEFIDMFYEDILSSLPPSARVDFVQLIITEIPGALTSRIYNLDSLMGSLNAFDNINDKKLVIEMLSSQLHMSEQLKDAAMAILDGVVVANEQQPDPDNQPKP